MPRIHPNTRVSLAVLLGSAVISVLAGCRGETSHQPPIHIVPNMDWQDKLKAQSASKFEGWKDGRGMRIPVHGTIARGSLPQHLNQLVWNSTVQPGAAGTAIASLYQSAGQPDDAKLHIYKLDDGTYVKANPLPKTREVIDRGRERFEINCAVCHGLNGRGMGIVGRKLPVKPPNLVKPAEDDHPLTRNDPTKLLHEDGKLFEIITNGSATMQPYRFQVSVADRWAIIHYIRALQFRAAN